MNRRHLGGSLIAAAKIEETTLPLRCAQGPTWISRSHRDLYHSRELGKLHVGTMFQNIGIMPKPTVSRQDVESKPPGMDSRRVGVAYAGINLQLKRVKELASLALRARSHRGQSDRLGVLRYRSGIDSKSLWGFLTLRAPTAVPTHSRWSNRRVLTRLNPNTQKSPPLTRRAFLCMAVES